MALRTSACSTFTVSVLMLGRPWPGFFTLHSSRRYLRTSTHMTVIRTMVSDKAQEVCLIDKARLRSRGKLAGALQLT